MQGCVSITRHQAKPIKHLWAGGKRSWFNLICGERFQSQFLIFQMSTTISNSICLKTTRTDWHALSKCRGRQPWELKLSLWFHTLRGAGDRMKALFHIWGKIDSFILFVCLFNRYLLSCSNDPSLVPVTRTQPRRQAGSGLAHLELALH